MKFIKNNKKLIIGIIIGLVISIPVVYATGTILFQSSQVSFDNTRAKLKNAYGEDVTTVEEAIETLVNGSCSSSPFRLGDYIDMTPTSTSFTPDTTLTGLDDFDTFRGNSAGTTTVAGTLNPSELSVWRVIKINGDCTVEVVSEYVSSVKVKFASKVGYQNLVYYLNEIAKQYANTTYTLDSNNAPDGAFRNVGYGKQTKKITNTTRLDDNTLGTSNGLWYMKDNYEENLGGGDTKFGTDMNLLSHADVPLRAVKPNTTSYTSYWLASRLFLWNTASSWYFSARNVNTSGYVDGSGLLNWSNSGFVAYNYNHAVRPIVTLKSGLSIASGSGTSASHYTLSAS